MKTETIPAAARRAAEVVSLGEWDQKTIDTVVAAIIARECHIAETVSVLRDFISKVDDASDGKINFRRDFADRARDLLAKLEEQ